MKPIVEKIANLLSVKSITTIILTVVFSILALNNQLTQEFLTIYSVIIAFYFGTQHEKNSKEIAQSQTEIEIMPTTNVDEEIIPDKNDNIII